MKSINKYIILLSISLFFSECYYSSNFTQLETLSVDISNVQDVSIFDLFSRVELIPLETTEMSLIKNIDKVVYFNNKYFVLDYNDAEILVFNSAGKYLYKINERGDGPNQYFNISDFSIDEHSETINILAPVNNAVYEYDISGQFISKYQLPDINGAYQKIMILNKDTLAFWTYDYENRLKFYSKDSDSIFRETFKEGENIVKNFSLIFPHKTHLTRSSSHLIYNIKDAKVYEHYKWDFGKYNNTINQIKKFEQLSSNDIRQHIPKILNSENINVIQTLHGCSNKYYYNVSST